MQQQHRHRLADDVAAADHDRVTAGDRDVLALQHLDDAGRRAGHELRPVLHEQPDARRTEAVHVLGRIDCVEDRLLGSAPHAFGQRRLHEDAVVIAGSRSAVLTSASASASDAVAGRRSRSTRKPALVPALTLLPTYTSDAGSLPARTMPSPGGRPCCS